MPPLTLMMQGGDPRRGINDLQGKSRENTDRLGKIESFLARYQPKHLTVEDNNGRNRRYAVLAADEGSAPPFTFGHPFRVTDVSANNIPSVRVEGGFIFFDVYSHASADEVGEYNQVFTSEAAATATRPADISTLAEGNNYVYLPNSLLTKPVGSGMTIPYHAEVTTDEMTAYEGIPLACVTVTLNPSTGVYSLDIYQYQIGYLYFERASSTAMDFQTVAAGTNGSGNFLFNVMPGTIVFHDDIFRIPAASGQSYAAQFTVSSTPGTYYIWIDLGNSFAPTSPSIQGSATIWSGSPDQPFPPARRYWNLATITVTASGSPSVASAAIDLIWRGSITWPSIYGYYL